MIFLDKHPSKDSWIELFTKRFPIELRSRLKFHSNLAFSDYLKAVGAAHVVLDPFPTSIYEASFIALSIGIPVITMPSKFMSNRMTYSLLSRMGWTDGLVVKSQAEYIEQALQITHKPKVRTKYTEKIMATRSRLFDCSKVSTTWRKFFQYSLHKLKEANDEYANITETILLPD